MSNRREFEIAFVGLKPGVHLFQYEVDKKFFEEYGEQDFKNPSAQVKLKLEKNNSFMILRFEIGGKAEVNCDRCNNELPFQLFEEFVITVKLVDEPELMNDQEVDPDVSYLSRNESHLDIRNWIYEFVSLSIPMQKTCEYDNMDGPFCNTETREILQKISVKEETLENPLWQDLKKIKLPPSEELN